MVVYYNQDVFAAADLMPPETWTVFLEGCQTLLDLGITPLALQRGESWHAGELLTDLLAGLGGAAFFDRAAEGDWDRTVLKAGLETLSDLAAEGYIQLLDDAEGALQAGTAAMVLGGDWYIPYWEGAARLGAFLLPAQEIACRGCAIQSVEQCYGISAQCEVPELAWALLQQMMETAAQTAPAPESELRQAVKDLYSMVEDSVLWIDRGIGGDVGTAFNQLALAVASGRDWETEMSPWALPGERSPACCEATSAPGLGTGSEPQDCGFCGWRWCFGWAFPCESACWPERRCCWWPWQRVRCC